MKHFLTFDTELATIIDDEAGGNWAERGPFDFSVAATCDHAGETRIWHSTDTDGSPSARMTRDTALALLRHLRVQQEAGIPIVTWNGLGFDFRWLGHAAGDVELAGQIALDHFDPMFQFFCQRGFPVSLAKVAEGLGVTQMKTMSGKDAPKAWSDGKFAEVIEYVRGDAQITATIIAGITSAGGVRWRTQKGTIQGEAMRELRPVRDLIALPTPDQSWMSEPIPKSKFFDWIPGVDAGAAGTARARA